MEQFIFDIYSIFFQLLQHTAPDYVGDYSFLMACYIASAVAVIVTIWAFCKVASSLASACLRLFYRGGE